MSWLSNAVKSVGPLVVHRLVQALVAALLVGLGVVLPVDVPPEEPEPAALNRWCDS